MMGLGKVDEGLERMRGRPDSELHVELMHSLKLQHFEIGVSMRAIYSKA